MTHAQRRYLQPRRSSEQVIDVAAIGSRGRRGLAKFARLVNQLGDNPRVPTKLERLLVGILRDPALPRPVREYEVVHAGRVVARIDFAWPGPKVGLEADGFKWHSSTAAFRRDRERSNDLTQLGWKLHRVTWWDAIERPDRVRSNIQALLGIDSLEL